MTNVGRVLHGMIRVVLEVWKALPSYGQVLIPALVLTVVIAYRYRESNKKATYRPDWEYSLLAESIWWGLPFIIVSILSVIVWRSSHELNPYEPLKSDVKPIVIQVVALQWKWLFIYPEQGIASLNVVQFPEKTPINFHITADAPMNSFWIPQLGGQIYAMPGMSTQLHLIANEVGSYRGSSANISGRGFAGMTFKANSLTQDDFDSWVTSAQRSPNHLGFTEYNTLIPASENNPVVIYQLDDTGLYDDIVMKYMMPAKGE